MTIENRCPWGNTIDKLMQVYHDTEWGKPCYGEHKLFEMLCLEGAQAGLSWRCILHKRERYKIVFDDFDVRKIAGYDETKISGLMQDVGIVRNRFKIQSVVTNAKAVLRLYEQGTTLVKFFWDYVGGMPVINRYALQAEVPAKTELSDKISKDMQKLGFKFVGSTIIYSYLQAIGIVNDHIDGCAYKPQTEKL
jgi:DNA-3-methyladenine glycosylase I